MDTPHRHASLAVESAPAQTLPASSPRSIRRRANEIFDRLPGHQTLRRIGSDRSVRAALFAFLLTRAIVLFIFILTPHIDRPGEGSFEVSRDSYIALYNTQIARELRRTVMVADVNWYVGIAMEGYERRAFDASTTHNWAFFPLLPLALRAASVVTGEFAVTGIVLSLCCFLLALILMHKTALAFGFDEATAGRAIFYLAAFPTSYFFSLPLTESLYLFLTVGSFYAARRERWWLAGVCGALASATRVTGVLLLPALAVLYWQMYGWRRPRANAFWLLLVPAGLVSFMVFLYSITGNPLAFKDVLKAWGRTTGLFLIPLYDYLSDPLEFAKPWDFKLINFAAAATALACGLWLLKRRDWALACYALFSVIVALSSILLQSQARYAMVVFPIFFALGLAGRDARFDQTLRAVSLVLLGLMSALFAAHFNIALS